MYESQPVRDKHKLTWHEEYLLGVIAAVKESFITEVMQHATEAMAEATAHKYLTQLADNKFLIQERSKEDKRYIRVTLTDKARKFLRELQHG